MVDIPGVAWTGEQFCQVVTALCSVQRVFMLDLKTDQVYPCMYVLLQWRNGIPACFQSASLQLTNEAEAHLIQLRVPDTKPDVPARPCQSLKRLLPHALVPWVSLPLPLGKAGREFPEEYIHTSQLWVQKTSILLWEDPHTLAGK